jgi:hypothetical protein
MYNNEKNNNIDDENFLFFSHLCGFFCVLLFYVEQKEMEISETTHQRLIEMWHPSITWKKNSFQNKSFARKHIYI